VANRSTPLWQIVRRAWTKKCSVHTCLSDLVDPVVGKDSFQAAFDLSDADGDGKIDAQEIEALLQYHEEL